MSSCSSKASNTYQITWFSTSPVSAYFVQMIFFQTGDGSESKCTIDQCLWFFPDWNKLYANEMPGWPKWSEVQRWSEFKSQNCTATCSECLLERGTGVLRYILAQLGPWSQLILLKSSRPRWKFLYTKVIGPPKRSCSGLDTVLNVCMYVIRVDDWSGDLNILNIPWSSDNPI